MNTPTIDTKTTDCTREFDNILDLRTKTHKVKDVFEHYYTPLITPPKMNKEIILIYKPVHFFFVVFFDVAKRFVDASKLKTCACLETGPHFSEAISYLTKQNNWDLKLRYYHFDVKSTLSKPIEVSNSELQTYYPDVIISKLPSYNRLMIGGKYELITYRCPHRVKDAKAFSSKDHTEMMEEVVPLALDHLHKDGQLIFSVYGLCANVKRLINSLCGVFKSVTIYKAFFSISPEVFVICKGYNEKVWNHANKHKHEVDNPDVDKLHERLKVSLHQNLNQVDKFEKAFADEDFFTALYNEIYNSQLAVSIAWCDANGLAVKPKFRNKLLDYEQQVLANLKRWDAGVSKRLVADAAIHPINKKTKPIDVYLQKMADKMGAFAYDIESRDIKKWNEMTDKIDMYRGLPHYLANEYNAGGARHRPSNAFCKLYEILAAHKILNDANGTVKTLHVCEAPGNFVFATNHYLFTQTNTNQLDWYANSLNPNNASVQHKYDQDIFKDEYGIMAKYPDRWLFGKDGTGDITNLDTIRSFPKEVHLVTGDCGLAIDPRASNDQQYMMAKINYSQILVGLTCLKLGGTFISKHFLPMTLPIIESYLHLLASCFSRLYIDKPTTSRPSSREIYIVAIGFKGINPKVLALLQDRLDFFDPMVPLYDVPEDFTDQYHGVVHDLVKKWINSLIRSFYFYDEEAFFEKHKSQLTKYKERKYKLWVDEFDFTKIDNAQKL